MPIDETILRFSAEALRTTLIGFPARRYELHLSASCQDAASALRIVPISSLTRYGISIRTVILKEEMDHRSTEDRASLATTSTPATTRDYTPTLTTRLKAMQGRFCYARKALHAMTMEQSGRWITFNEWRGLERIRSQESSCLVEVGAS